MKQLICMAAFSTLFLAAGGATAQVGTIDIKGAGPMHPLCRNCHQLDTNMIRGSLENFSMASQTLQIDVGTHKEILRFEDDVAIKNLKDIEDLKLYKGKGFRINYVEKKGEKHAVLITRFDILQTIKTETRNSSQTTRMYWCSIPGRPSPIRKRIFRVPSCCPRPPSTNSRRRCCRRTRPRPSSSTALAAA